MHDAAHDTSHTNKGKVLDTQVDTEAHHIEYVGKEEACHTSHIERRRKGTANAAGAIGRRGGKCLGEDDGEDKCNNEPHRVTVAIEDRAVDDSRGVAGKQVHNRGVALAVERREQEHQARQNHTADSGAYPWILEAREEVLHHIHHAGEVERHQAGDYAQGNYRRNFCHDKGVGLYKEELKGVTGVGICDCGTGDGRDKQGHDRHRGEVDHKHLDGEQHAGDRRLEDAGDARSGATAHQNHQNARRHAERRAQVGPDSGTGVYDRSLGSDRTAETDGNRRGYHRGIGVVALQPRLVLRD